MIDRRRRGIFLIEMLTVLLCVTVGGTLMVVSLASILRNHRQIVELGNRYAVLNDFLRCIREDVRKAAGAELRDGDGAGVRQVLAIGEAPSQVLYRFGEERIQRVGFPGDPVTDKDWNMKHGVVTPGVEPPTGGGDAVVTVTVLWHRTSKDNPEPTRRFDVALRCTGETRHEHD